MNRAGLWLLLVALAGCASPKSDDVPTGQFTDAHGLAVDPLDPAFVYVATHHGLFRGDGQNWSRVGTSDHDMMGFSIHPDGKTMWISGHPKSGGNLGLVISNDAGLSWRALSLPGADLHVMSASPAAPHPMWGVWRGELLRSDDLGASWTPRARIAASGLAPHPTHPDVVLIGTRDALLKSADGGRTTDVVAQGAFGALALSKDGDRMYAARPELHVSDDEGKTWTRVSSLSEPVGHLATGPDRSVVAASYRGDVWRSDDAGASWRQLHRAK